MSRALLVILDGYGVAADKNVSAVDKANTPFYDSLIKNYPNTSLLASGEAVGLPEGQFGNSEVGHLNIGAGRIVWQELSRINNSIKTGDFFANPVLKEAVSKGKQKGKIHLMGLFSDGGVHSHNEHIYALLRLCKAYEISNVYVHAFMDGRDTAPHSGINYVKQFEKRAAAIGCGEIASVIGRYYAMDRDNRWERVSKAYHLLTKGDGQHFESAESALENMYAKKITDEFIEASVINSSPESRIEPEDTVIFFNIRGDRAREITRALSENNFSEFPVQNLNLNYYSLTQYDITFEHVGVAYPPQDLVNTYGRVVSNAGLRQLRIAETEKYPHVTYFFNGGIEAPDPGEERVVVPSPKVATYDLQPEMSAPEVGDKLCAALESEKFDAVVLNFANPDMIGHTGDFDAAVKAVEAVDIQLNRVVTTALKHGYHALIIADHGNADCMYEKDGSPHTAHTTVPVPCILVSETEKHRKLRTDGILADVAPTLLKLLKLEQPKEMTGKSLF
ncbi:MAG: 2,3-bisphosphoglycerate-independent phosphoglycerate mutase [Balneolales bacterium]|nr:2,3-bisphosphoglycerate-independent phosphoglycerate mutase [Balneolales bacterium]